jgi:hypothetical protein
MDSKGKYETVHRKVKVMYEKDVMKNYQPSRSSWRGVLSKQLKLKGW